MAGEVLKLTAQIVTSHASMTELTTAELIREIKEVHRLLTAFLASEAEAPAAPAPAARQRGPRTVKMAESAEAQSVENEDGMRLGEPDYIEFMDSREG